jgi:hypothetical protein
MLASNCSARAYFVAHITPRVLDGSLTHAASSSRGCLLVSFFGVGSLGEGHEDVAGSVAVRALAAIMMSVS